MNNRDTINLNVLQQLGFTDKNQWLLFDEIPRNFLQWIQSSIDNSNIIDVIEKKNFDDLKNAGRELTDDELADEQKLIESYFPGFFAVNYDDIQVLQESLQFHQAAEAEMETRSLKLNSLERKQMIDLKQMEQQLLDLNYKHKLLSEDCLKKSKDLMDLQAQNHQLTAQLNELFVQQQNPPCLVYQLPLENYHFKCDQFLNHLELFIRHNFNASSSMDEIYDGWFNAMGDSMIEAKSRISEVERRKFQESISIAGLSNIINRIEGLQSNLNTDWHEAKSMIFEMEAEIENNEIELDVSQSEAQMLIDENCNQKCLKVFYDSYTIKHKRAMNRLSLINKCQELLNKVIINNEFLWTIMQLDLEKARNKVDNSDEMYREAQDCSKRLRQMKIQRKQESTMNQHLLKMLQDLLVEQLHMEQNQLPSINACLQELINFNQNVQSITTNLRGTPNYRRMHEMIQKIDDQSKTLRSFVFSGPVNRPQTSDAKFRVAIVEKQRKVKELEDSLNTIKLNYKENIVDQMQNRFYSLKEKLWIYFLTEPKKIHLAVKEVQKQAAKVGSTSYKALQLKIAKN